MSQQLVITAIGTDRTGIVSKLARLVTDYNANIIDSRMAVFGNEFTFIMLIQGDQAAISKIEYLIPSLGSELDLTTMTKRTTARPRTQVAAHYVLDYSGPDRVGTLGAITGLLASHNIYIGSLQSATTFNNDNTVQLHSQITVEIPLGINPSDIETAVMALLNELNLIGTFVMR
ncbi:MAG: transcriptional regulator [Rheinheimera sp.]|uniref:glycine cleavage system protein R n=1 Tax=Arsukibacterium sp. UBA3155 TaxID=1946058 RepID=UPI000C91ACAC|nr:ACT domain-containing protein [Arsukibacterium sp. UBA3155]MAD76856.1 transcriptional regulator [Rheinheimera sp.]|tara:strand:+ start:40687 stop:41208 length:522 start_codon:yes stop_codon:yes gene_type:complete